MSGSLVQAFGQNTCPAQNSARFTITPTTAAVIPVNGAVNFSWPWVVSISEPPARSPPVYEWLRSATT